MSLSQPERSKEATPRQYPSRNGYFPDFCLQSAIEACRLRIMTAWAWRARAATRLEPPCRQPPERNDASVQRPQSSRLLTAAEPQFAKGWLWLGPARPEPSLRHPKIARIDTKEDLANLSTNIVVHQHLRDIPRYARANGRDFSTDISVIGNLNPLHLLIPSPGVVTSNGQHT